jgi:hypothetical protein
MRATRVDESVFDELSGTSGADLISVFLPTHKRSREVAQDRIRLKNNLAEVDETLAGLGWKPRQRSDRLANAHDLLDDLEFWEHQESGLAVYVDDEGEVRAIASGRPLSTGTWVMPVFMVRPLAGDLDGLAVPVLALTKDEAALFVADEFGADEIPAELPSYEEVNWFVDREKERQQHPDMVGTQRGRHGHDPSARSDEDLGRFLREVDLAIESIDEETPLVVLGDDDIVGRFANVSRRPTLSSPNSGIRAPFSPTEIAEKVATHVADLGQRRAEEARTTAEEQFAIDMATADIHDAVPAAVGGRVDRVLIDPSAAPVWGRLDDMSMKVELHERQEAGDVDLLDRLVVWARDTGAEILATDSMIEDRPFVATFRY